ncbi:MAG: hypothetical protein KJ709_09340 [Nanoarchaeota archaeon]|nr:hypothetical protein [Nanoarchaeota archaeon]
MSKVKIFVNPFFGNEPFVFGSRIANHVVGRFEEEGQEAEVVLPHLYGERQQRILEEIGLDHFKLDPEIARFYKRIILDDGDYRHHLEDISIYARGAQEAIRALMPDIDIEINTGSRFMLGGGAATYYVFPYAFSQLLDRLSQTKALEDVVKNVDISGVKGLALEMEHDYDLVFIPSYNTLSFDDKRQPVPGEISTPPLRPLSSVVHEDIPEDSVYVMFSGTGADYERLQEQVEAYKGQGRNVITQPWVPVEDVMKLPPEVVAHENVAWVEGRAGFGTIWLCQQAGKVFTPLDYRRLPVPDDVEIYFNNQTLRHKGLLKATEEMKASFPTMDGIAFVGDKIFEHYCAR